MESVPVLVWVALDYFWKHCPDVKAQADVDSDEEWQLMCDEYDGWKKVNEAQETQ